MGGFCNRGKIFYLSHLGKTICHNPINPPFLTIVAASFTIPSQGVVRMASFGRHKKVPHLDARKIGGKPVLLFGPFAGFSPRRMRCVFVADWRVNGGSPSHHPFIDGIFPYMKLDEGFHSHGGTPHSWMVYKDKNPIYKWMTTRGTRNHHLEVSKKSWSPKVISFNPQIVDLDDLGVPPKKFLSGK